MPESTFHERTLFGLSLVLAPLLFTASSLFWTTSGEYGVVGGALLVFGSLFWIVAFAALFGALRSRTPRYAVWGWLVAAYGAVCGGAAFAFQGMFVEMHGATHAESLAGLARYPVVANAIFWIGGPAFPISLLVLGVILARTRVAPWWAGAMLALGGALFPVARIPRIEGFALGVDLLMLIPAAYFGFNMLRGRHLNGSTHVKAGLT
jgi:hypothetical protein